MEQPIKQPDEKINTLNIEKFPTMSIDVDKYLGRRTRIEKEEVIRVPSIYGPNGGRLPEGQTVMVPVLKISTEPLEVIQLPDGSTKEIRASELFNLKEKVVNGQKIIGFSEHPRNKLFQFLKKMKVNDPKQLIGLYVTIVDRVSKNGNKWLGFM